MAWRCGVWTFSDPYRRNVVPGPAPTARYVERIRAAARQPPRIPQSKLHRVRWSFPPTHGLQARGGTVAQGLSPGRRAPAASPGPPSPAPRTEMCPSSGRSHSSAEGVRRASHSPCELGTTRSRPPCRNRTGGRTCPGSNPHGATYGQIVVHDPARGRLPWAARRRRPTTTTRPRGRLIGRGELLRVELGGRQVLLQRGAPGRRGAQLRRAGRPPCPRTSRAPRRGTGPARPRRPRPGRVPAAARRTPGRAGRRRNGP